MEIFRKNRILGVRGIFATLTLIMCLLLTACAGGGEGRDDDKRESVSVSRADREKARLDSLQFAAMLREAHVVDSLQLEYLLQDSLRQDSIRLDSIARVERYVKILPDPAKLVSHRSMGKVEAYLKSIGYSGKAYIDPEGEGYSDGEFSKTTESGDVCTVKWNENHPDITVRVTVGDTVVTRQYYETAKSLNPPGSVTMKKNTVTIFNKS